MKTAVKPPGLMGRRHRERAMVRIQPVSPCKTDTGVSGNARCSRGATSSTTSRRGDTHKTRPPPPKTSRTAGSTASVLPDPVTAHVRKNRSPERTASRQRSDTRLCPSVRGEAADRQTAGLPRSSLPQERKKAAYRPGGRPENDATITADARPAAPAAPGTEQSLPVPPHIGCNANGTRPAGFRRRAPGWPYPSRT